MPNETRSFARMDALMSIYSASREMCGPASKVPVIVVSGDRLAVTVPPYLE